MKIFAETDRGRVRNANQDVYMTELINDEQAVFAVCDGMGGANGGNVASAVAAEAFAAAVKDLLKADMSADYISEILTRAINQANRQIFEQAQLNAELSGMGTTIVAGIVLGNTAVIANIGDSRAYLIDKDSIRQITTDHSVVMELVARGDITEEQAANHPNKNLITRALGIEPVVASDLFKVELKKGMFILCCSDGLTNLVTDKEILAEINRGESADCCKRLIDIANARGGYDNITALLLEV